MSAQFTLLKCVSKHQNTFKLYLQTNTKLRKSLLKSYDDPFVAIAYCYLIFNFFQATTQELSLAMTFTLDSSDS